MSIGLFRYEDQIESSLKIKSRTSSHLSEFQIKFRHYLQSLNRVLYTRLKVITVAIIKRSSCLLGIDDMVRIITVHEA